MKWWVGMISSLSLFLIIMIFGYEKMFFVFEGVKIKAVIENPDGSTISIIKGQAPKATYITLNGREIFIDKDGNFSESIAFLPGFSIVTLHAKDKFGKTAEKKFEIVKKDNAPAIALLNK